MHVTTLISTTLLLAACAGEIELAALDDDPPPDAAPDAREVAPAIAASLDRPAVSTELGATAQLAVTVRSVGGFAGYATVSASVDGIDGLTVDAPATVHLSPRARRSPRCRSPSPPT